MEPATRFELVTCALRVPSASLSQSTESSESLNLRLDDDMAIGDLRQYVDVLVDDQDRLAGGSQRVEAA